MAALLFVVSTAVVAIAIVLGGRAQASTAADAAALAAAVATYPPAAVVAPTSAAKAAASANGAEVTSCVCRVDSSLETRVVAVAVEVPVHTPLFGQVHVRSTARAEFDPRRWLGR